MKAKYFTCDVFTADRFGGNQLAVFPDATGIPDHRLQSIAKEFNFSETTFVYPPKESAHTKWVRIFTPGGELPFAGHPTVGTAFVLAATGIVRTADKETDIIFEEGVGPVPVKIIVKDGVPSFAQLTAARPPEIVAAGLLAKDVAAFLGIGERDIDLEAFPMQYVSVGVSFLFVPIRSIEAMRRMRVDGQKMETVLRGAMSQDVYVFTRECEQSDSQFHVRMFAPLLGIPEDPATGSAGASFAGYLATLDPLATGGLRWKVEQGFEMGRPSLLYLEADKSNGSVSAIRVGGNSVMVCEGEMEV